MPDWGEVLKEIQVLAAQSNAAVDIVRRKYLTRLHTYTGRNVIAYYSGWLSKPGIAQTEITDEDMNGFMMAVNKLDRAKGLDLILHTPGGNMAATQAIVLYLRKMFGNDMRAVVPQLAMSAGTMLACSCSKIIMAKHSSLGPTDPLINGIPAVGIIDEWERAKAEVAEGTTPVAMWHAIVSQYPPTFLSQCENAVQWAREFVTQQLEAVMFGGEADAKKRALDAVARLTDYSGNKSHSRHIPYEECANSIRLNVDLLEDDAELQDLVLTVHHCFMHTLMNTAAFKMIENHLGVALVKQQGMVVIPQQR